jgi:predicted phosphate transport protein (TIGR00153 family)
MLRRLLPTQNNFFDLFQKDADTLVLTASQFHALLLDLKNPQQYVDAIAIYEEEADKIAHVIFELLHKTFITPFDRHDIHQLTSNLDDVLDIINRCAQRLSFYELSEVPAELIALADLSLKCTKLLKEAIYRLDLLKNSADILKYCEDINTLESQAHQLVLAGEKDLFSKQEDFKTFFKLKEVYSWTKSVINRCQDVANIIKGIVLEYS